MYVVCRLLPYCCFIARTVLDLAYPRASTIESLLSTIRQQPRLGKDASSALVDLGESMHANATTEETNILLRNTLSQEVYVRHSCLQTLQVINDRSLEGGHNTEYICSLSI